MQHQIPQFIEIEDQIFGPLTLKQFLYVAGGAAFGFIIWTLLPTFLAILIGVPVVGFFMALAFYQVNGRPFIKTVENAISYFFTDKLYIWKKEDKKITPKKEEAAKNVVDQINVPRLSESKLKELSWSLDIDKKLER